MACTRPRQGWWSKTINPTGKRSITTRASEAYVDRPITYACGQCQNCRGERALDWATRISHESSMYEANCFVTLTYDDGALPKGGSLNFRDHQLFMKNLRRHFEPRKIRYYSAGEYGETTLRPHFHACLFNINFDDKEKWKKQNGEQLYVSPTLNDIWNRGRAVIGSLTFASAAYVARYILKKMTGPESHNFYEVHNHQTGEVWDVEPEDSLMSQSIGIPWLEKYWRDVYPHDFFHINGKKIRPPVAYDRWLEKKDPAMYAEVKARRQASAAAHHEPDPMQRHKDLLVKEILNDIRMQHYRRVYEQC